MQYRDPRTCYSTDTRPNWLRHMLTTVAALGIRLSLDWQRIKDLRTISVEALEVGFAVLEIVIGAAFIHPAEAIAQTPHVAAIAHVLPPITRAYVLLPAGIITLIGFADDQNWLRRLGRIAGSFYWGFSSALFFMHSSADYTWKVYSAFAFFDYWAFRRVGVAAILKKYRGLTFNTRVSTSARQIAAAALRTQKQQEVETLVTYGSKS